MRKDALRNLIKQHEKNLQARIFDAVLQEEYFQKLSDYDNIPLAQMMGYFNKLASSKDTALNNLQARITNIVLQEEFFQRQSVKQEIPFVTVIQYLQTNGFDFTSINNQLTHKKSDDNLLRFLIEGKDITQYKKKEEKEAVNNLFSKIPQEVFDDPLAAFFDNKTVAAVSTLSSSYYDNMKSMAIWERRFIEAGCDPSVISQISQANIIQNYKNLYRSVTRFSYEARSELTVSALLCLSGEVNAIQHGVEKLGINLNSVGNDGENALHYTALSRSIAAMDYAIKLGINPNSVDDSSTNALHYTAQGGSVAAMNHAINKLKIKPKSVDKNGANALHYAAWSGSVDAIDHAINKLGIDPKSADKDGTNILHYAIFSGSVAAVKFIRQLSYHLNLNLDPNVPDANGYNAFWYASQSSNAAAIKEILQMPIQKLMIDAKLSGKELKEESVMQQIRRNISDVLQSQSVDEKVIVGTSSSVAAHGLYKGSSPLQNLKKAIDEVEGDALLIKQAQAIKTAARRLLLASSREKEKKLSPNSLKCVREIENLAAKFHEIELQSIIKGRKRAIAVVKK